MYAYFYTSSVWSFQISIWIFYKKDRTVKIKRICISNYITVISREVRGQAMKPLWGTMIVWRQWLAPYCTSTPRPTGVPTWVREECGWSSLDTPALFGPYVTRCLGVALLVRASPRVCRGTWPLTVSPLTHLYKHSFSSLNRSFPSVCSRFVQATSLGFQHIERLVDIWSSYTR